MRNFISLHNPLLWLGFLAHISIMILFMSFALPYLNPALHKYAAIAGAAWGGIGLAVPILIFFISSRNRRKRMGIQHRRVWAFTLPWAGEWMIRKHAAGMTNEELLRSLYFPGNRRKANIFITEELVRRGLSRERIELWRPNAQQLTIPPAVTVSMSPLEYFRLVRSRRRQLMLYRAVGVICAISTSLLFFKVFSKGDVGALDSPPGLALFAGISCGLIATAVFLLPLLAIATFSGRNRAIRVLLLRPFGKSKISFALKQVVRREIGQLGPVFTLADRQMKYNVWNAFALSMLLSVLLSASYVRAAYFIIRLIVGPWLRPPRKFVYVFTRWAYLGLIDNLLDKYRLSFDSFISANQVFPVRCQNPWWQATVTMLLNSADLIVMDVSLVGTGSAWELVELRRWNVGGKCIFIAQDEYEDAARKMVSELLPVSFGRKLFVYDKAGRFRERAEFRSVLVAAVTVVLKAWKSSQQTMSGTAATTF